MGCSASLRLRRTEAARKPVLAMLPSDSDLLTQPAQALNYRR